MSKAQYTVGSEGQTAPILESNGSLNMASTDELQEQMAQIAQTLNRKKEEAIRRQQEEKEEAMRQKQKIEHPSLIKQVTSDPSVLYSFINWENPGRTFGSFVTVMSLIISTRFFSPIQWILKIFCIILGATSVLEIFGRVTSKANIMSRVRPQPYYRPSDDTYSRLFSEIHDGVDMALVKLQKIIYAEELNSTAIAFALSFLTFWLIKAIPPFWLAIIGTLITYILGPIFTRQISDPNAPSWKPIIDQRARDLKDSTVDTASSITNRTANAVNDLSSKAMDSASSTTDRVAGAAQDLKNYTVDTTSSAADYTAATAQDLKDRTMGTASYTTGRATEMGRNIKTRAQETAFSTNDSNGASKHGLPGTDFSSDSATAAPNALGFDADGLSNDRRAQLHPLESGSVNVRL